jgi:hypothetical protein
LMDGISRLLGDFDWCILAGLEGTSLATGCSGCHPAKVAAQP